MNIILLYCNNILYILLYKYSIINKNACDYKHGLPNQTIYSGKIKQVVKTCISLYLNTFGYTFSYNLLLVVEKEIPFNIIQSENTFSKLDT